MNIKGLNLIGFYMMKLFTEKKKSSWEGREGEGGFSKPCTQLSAILRGRVGKPCLSRALVWTRGDNESSRVPPETHTSLSYPCAKGTSSNLDRRKGVQELS